MMDALQRCINELCLYCGKYENEHEGACDNCKWYEKKYERKTLTDVLKDCADDLVQNCKDSGCFKEHEDDDGNTYYTDVCPFLDRSDGDVWTAGCLIGDPEEWGITRKEVQT